MTAWTGTFETGVDGATVATTDAGSANSWSDRNFSADASLQYSNEEAYGALSCRMVMTATPGQPYVAWTTATIGTPTELWGRVYMWHSGLPNASHCFVRGLSGASRAWEAYIENAGRVVLRDNAGNVVGLGSVAIAIGQWIRLEWHVVNSTTAGVIEVRLYNDADSTSISETITSTGSFSTLSNTDAVRIGEIFGLNASRTVYMDNILVTPDEGYPGPATPGGAIYLDGSSWMQVPDDASLDLGDVMSVEIWFKTSKTNYCYLMNKGNTGTNESFSTYVNPITADGAVRTDKTAVVLLLDTTATHLNDGEWHHFVFTKNGASFAAYIDGAPSGTNGAAAALENCNEVLAMGAYFANGVMANPANNMEGYLAAPAIYSTVLSAARVLAHYDAAETGDYDAEVISDNPVSYWPFTETTGSIAYDAMSNNNPGTYEGAALDITGPIVREGDAAAGWVRSA